jgi:hypothetical protein
MDARSVERNALLRVVRAVAVVALAISVSGCWQGLGGSSGSPADVQAVKDAVVRLWRADIEIGLLPKNILRESPAQQAAALAKLATLGERQRQAAQIRSIWAPDVADKKISENNWVLDSELKVGTFYGVESTVLTVTEWQSVHVLRDGTAIAFLNVHLHDHSNGDATQSSDDQPVYMKLRRLNGRWYIEERVEYGSPF